MRLEWNLKDLFVDNKAFYQEIDNVKVGLSVLLKKITILFIVILLKSCLTLA